MTKVIVDASLLARLKELKEELQFVDSSGRVLGHFKPAENGRQANAREPKISSEEIRRRLQAGGGRSLARILADLEKSA